MRLRRIPRHQQMRLFEPRPSRVTWWDLPLQVREETQRLLAKLLEQDLRRRQSSESEKEASHER